MHPIFLSHFIHTVCPLLPFARHGFYVSTQSFKGPFADTSTERALLDLAAKLEGQHLNLFFVNVKLFQPGSKNWIATAQQPQSQQQPQAQQKQQQLGSGSALGSRSAGAGGGRGQSGPLLRNRFNNGARPASGQQLNRQEQGQKQAVQAALSVQVAGKLGQQGLSRDDVVGDWVDRLDKTLHADYAVPAV